MDRSTVQKKIQWGNLTKISSAIEASLNPIEPLLCNIYIQSVNMGQLTNMSEGLKLANFLIEGTCWQEQWKILQLS